MTSVYQEVAQNQETKAQTNGLGLPQPEECQETALEEQTGTEELP